MMSCSCQYLLCPTAEHASTLRIDKIEFIILTCSFTDSVDVCTTDEKGFFEIHTESPEQSTSESDSSYLLNLKRSVTLKNRNVKRILPRW